MILKAFAGSLVLVAVMATPPAAGLTYSIHQEVRQGAAASQDPMASLVGPAIMQMYPPGGLDQSVSVADRGMRVEQKQVFGGAPAGAVTLTRPDGTAVVMDPAAKTFWKQPTAAAAAEMMQQLGLKPEIKVTKTGQFETIEGMRAELVSVTVGMSMPGADPAQVSPGLGQMSMGLDLWVTDAIKSPVGTAAMSDALLAKFAMADIKGLKDLNDGRFMLKQVMKMFGLEIVTTVKNISKADVPDALLEVPKDFREITPPGGGVSEPRPLSSFFPSSAGWARARRSWPASPCP